MLLSGMLLAELAEHDVQDSRSEQRRDERG